MVLVIVYVIGAVPALTPVIIPDAVPVAVAIPVAPLLHVPPPGAEPREMVAPPPHTVNVGPLIGAGVTFTVARILVVQPVLVTVYTIKVFPGPVPVMIPEVAPMEAIPVLAELHVPGPVASVSEVEYPLHTTGVPTMATGPAFTVIVRFTVQPDGIV